MATFKHNQVDIYIKERDGKREIRVPWLPASIEYESGGTTFASYDILNKGEIQVPTGSGLAQVSWESQFPGVNRQDKSLQRGTFHHPSYYHKILESWKKKGTPLNLMVTGYPINMDVYLSDYSATPAGGFGDMEYSVEFIEDVDVTITSKKTKKKRAAKKFTTYTIKKGDTLWKIAKRFLEKGSNWKVIYKANKTIIEQTAKKRGKKSSSNGRWIYPGTKIKIPQNIIASTSTATKTKTTGAASASGVVTVGGIT